MKPNRTLLQGAVLGAMLLISVYCDDELPRVRRKRCKCKKYIEQINRDIDERLDEFENRFEKYFSKSMGDLKNIQSGSDHRLQNITEQMNKTRDTLSKQSYSLRVLQEDMYAQDVTMGNLNTNFKALDAIVKNLSVIVESLESTVRNMAGQQQQQHVNDRPDPQNLIENTDPDVTSKMAYPKDCDEVYQSGGMKFLGDYYLMVKPEKAATPFQAVCKIIDRAGWTVIQRRQDGRENFSRNWVDYKNGFGNLQAEFWLGNDKIHHLSSQGDYMLKIVMEDWNGKTYYAEYDRFRVSGEDDDFRLHVGGYHGNAGDSLTAYWKTHDGMPFSTRDHDNDNRYYDNCAEIYSGGWWYNSCFDSHLNGVYYRNGSHNNYFKRNGIQWNAIHTYSSLKFVEMMIRPSGVPKLPNEV